MIEKLKPVLSEFVYNQLIEVSKIYPINTVNRLAHFISQCDHESGHFDSVIENLNYSSDRLLKIFPKYFTKQSAVEYGRQPNKIASRVYANRMGNGDELSQDGYKYCGRGYLQCTGKNNYAALDKLVSDDLLSKPGLVAIKYPMLSAAWFFDSNHLWMICDKGPIAVKELTKRINGGYIGLDDRQKLFDKYYKILQ